VDGMMKEDKQAEVYGDRQTKDKAKIFGENNCT
jgi:hypothetical protein